MEGTSNPTPSTVEGVFRDFEGRRSGFLKAFTTDLLRFRHKCDPEKENLCLYAFPNETWEVNLPVEYVPSELPEPANGINFARDEMSENEWLSLVAVHSDTWLLSVAFYFGAKFGFCKSERNKLFRMVNEVPTLFEIVTGAIKHPTDHVAAQTSSNRTLSQQPNSQPRGEEEDEDEEATTLCGACGDSDADDEFWICCDICERWFHGECVKITSAKAEQIEQYECPSCRKKQAARF